MRKFDTDIIRLMTAFENITDTEVRDCIYSDVIYFLVNTGKIAISIGRNGQKIKTAERMLKKPIKVFEWNEDSKQFIKNMIPHARKITIQKDRATVSLNSEKRGATIGKAGNNIRAIRELLLRNSKIKELKIL